MRRRRATRGPRHRRWRRWGRSGRARRGRARRPGRWPPRPRAWSGAEIDRCAIVIGRPGTHGAELTPGTGACAKRIGRCRGGEPAAAAGGRFSCRPRLALPRAASVRSASHVPRVPRVRPASSGSCSARSFPPAAELLPEGALPKALPAETPRRRPGRSRSRRASARVEKPGPTSRQAGRQASRQAGRQAGRPRRPTSRRRLSAAQHHRDGALALLALLQREGRLVDFLREAIDDASDDAIGAAVREVHRGCRKVLEQVPVDRGGDAGRGGAKASVPKGLRPGRGPADRRGEGRAAVQAGRFATTAGAVGDAKLPCPLRGRRPHGAGAGRGGALRMKILGIDLGTTNSALAVAGERRGAGARGPDRAGGRAGRGARSGRPCRRSCSCRARSRCRRQLQLPWSGPLRYAVGHARARPRRGAAATGWCRRRSRGCATRRSSARRRCCRRGAQRELRRRRGRRAGVAGQRVGALPGAPARGVGRREPRRAGGRAGGAGRRCRRRSIRWRAS